MGRIEIKAKESQSIVTPYLCMVFAILIFT